MLSAHGDMQDTELCVWKAGQDSEGKALDLYNICTWKYVLQLKLEFHGEHGLGKEDQLQAKQKQKQKTQQLNILMIKESKKKENEERKKVESKGRQDRGRQEEEENKTPLVFSSSTPIIHAKSHSKLIASSVLQK